MKNLWCRALGTFLTAMVLVVTGAPRARAAPPTAPPEEAPREADARTAPEKEDAREASGASDQARQKALPIFREGIAKFDAGYYREAIALFQRAYAIFPSHKIHTRIALAYKWIGDNLKALEHYELYLKSVRGTPEAEKDAVFLSEVEAEVSALLKRIAQIRIMCEAPSGAELRVNGQLVGTAPLDKTIRLKPGDANVTGMATGHHAFKRDIQISAGQRATVRVALIAIKPKVVREVVHVKVPWFKRWWLWTTVGVVVAAGAAGAGLGAYYTRPTRDLEGVRINHDSLGVRF